MGYLGQSTADFCLLSPASRCLDRHFQTGPLLWCRHMGGGIWLRPSIPAAARDTPQPPPTRFFDGDEAWRELVRRPRRPICRQAKVWLRRAGRLIMAAKKLIASPVKVQRGSRCDIGCFNVITIETSARLHGSVERGNQQAASEQSDILTIKPKPVLWARHCPLRVTLLSPIHRPTGFRRQSLIWRVVARPIVCFACPPASRTPQLHQDSRRAVVGRLSQQPVPGNWPRLFDIDLHDDGWPFPNTCTQSGLPGSGPALRSLAAARDTPRSA